MGGDDLVKVRIPKQHPASNSIEVEMKGKIEATANIVVIVLAVVLGSVFLKDRLSPPAPEPEVGRRKREFTSYT